MDATELWLWHAGSSLCLATDGGTARLGGDMLAGDLPQATVPAGAWQSACAPDGWALVSCIVTPGFSFDGFELAPPGWSPRPHPR